MHVAKDYGNMRGLQKDNTMSAGTLILNRRENLLSLVAQNSDAAVIRSTTRRLLSDYVRTYVRSVLVRTNSYIRTLRKRTTSGIAPDIFHTRHS